jgi:hypothetical protein
VGFVYLHAKQGCLQHSEHASEEQVCSGRFDVLENRKGTNRGANLAPLFALLFDIPYAFWRVRFRLPKGTSFGAGQIYRLCEQYFVSGRRGFFFMGARTAYPCTKVRVAQSRGQITLFLIEIRFGGEPEELAFRMGA